MRSLIFALFALVLFSCKKEASSGADSPANNPNVLLVIADDFGLDACPNYSIGAMKPSMPNLQKLMSEGVTFDNFWSSPVCTPTRASIITGKYGYKTGVLQVDDVLPATEQTLQQHITAGTSSQYAQAVIGKWHLSKDVNHPNSIGIDYYAGMLNGGVQNYYNWPLVVNGQSSTSTEYTTSKLTNLAIDWVEEQKKPWFLWLAYNAPHTPFHLPPDSLHSQGSLPSDQASIDSNPLPYYLAACEAIDHELGRLLNSLSAEEKANTTILFIGDNGTPGGVAQEYSSQRTKGSVYKGGINVPLVISGNGVTRQNEREDALVVATDIFATVSELTGAMGLLPEDTRSFWNLSSGAAGNRDYMLSEIGASQDSSNVAIRNTSHKYISFINGNESLFDLLANPMEKPNLLNPNQLPLATQDSLMLFELKAEMDRIRN
jgi:arylsulfatase A-like enzyme